MRGKKRESVFFRYGLQSRAKIRVPNDGAHASGAAPAGSTGGTDDSPEFVLRWRRRRRRIVGGAHRQDDRERFGAS
jgi:hypothetical protein